jgi:PKD repeat protein
MIHPLGPSSRDRSEKRLSTWNRIAASGLRAVATFAVAVTAVVPVASAPAFAAIVIPNDSPAVDAGGDYSANEGSQIPLAGTVTDPDGNLATTLWTSNGGGSFIDPGMVGTRFNAIQDGTYTITLTGTDDLGASASDQATVTVRNVHPSIGSRIFSGTMAEGSTITVSGNIGDPGVLDVHTATVEWFTGGPLDPAFVDQDANTYSASHIYLDDVRFVEVDLCISDGQDQQCNATHLDILNVTPSIDTLDVDTGLHEGSTVNLAATFSDPGILDTHTATIDWGEGTGPIGTTVGGNTVAGSNLYEQDGTYTVTLCVTDDDAATSCATTTAVIDNVAPSIDALNVDTGLDEGSTVNLAATFSDAGILDTHTATIDWDEGAGPIAATIIGTSVAGSNRYEQDGTYTVRLCVTDDDETTCRSTGITINNVDPAVTGIGDQTIDEGDTFGPVTLATFSDPGILDTHSATADWGEGAGPAAAATTANSIAGSNLYDQDGSYPVTVTVTDDTTGTGQHGFTVFVGNVAPAVDAGPDVGIDAGDTVSLDAGFTDPGADTWTATVEWGDGSAVEAASVDQAAMTITGSHTYQGAGTFTATVCVTDDDEQACDGFEITVTAVTPEPPVADTGGPYAGDEGAPLPIDGSASSDADGTIVSYQWAAGGGSFDDPTLATPTFTAPDNGTYTITLEITDDDGLTDTSSTTVKVTNVAPSVNAGAGGPALKTNTPSGLSATFTDPGADTHTATIDWGDGTPKMTIDPAASPIGLSHKYANPGQYMIRVTVTDDDGGSASDTVEVTVTGELSPPTADPGGPYDGREGSRIRLSASGSSDEDGEIVSYRWTADRGAFDDPNALRPRFTAPDNGTYKVTLEVRDNDGLAGTSSTTVRVSNASPNLDAGRGATIRPGEEYRLRASFTDPRSADTHSATIDWGDGTTTEIDTATSPLALNHRYTDTGRYTVRVTVVDDDGGRDRDTVKVTVKSTKSNRDRIRDWIRDLLKRLRDRMRGNGRWWR